MATDLYNPMTGTRLDLTVFDEPADVAQARWTGQRRAYLDALIADPSVSDFAKALYKRERQRL